MNTLLDVAYMLQPLTIPHAQGKWPVSLMWCVRSQSDPAQPSCSLPWHHLLSFYIIATLIYFPFPKHAFSHEKEKTKQTENLMSNLSLLSPFIQNRIVISFIHDINCNPSIEEQPLVGKFPPLLCWIALCSSTYCCSWQADFSPLNCSLPNLRFFLSFFFYIYHRYWPIIFFSCRALFLFSITAILAF